MAATESPSEPARRAPARRLGDYRGVAGPLGRSRRCRRRDPRRIGGDLLRSALLSRRRRHRTDTTSAAGCSRNTASPTTRPASRSERERPWQLDSWPLVISAAEWKWLSRARRPAGAVAEPDSGRYLRPAPLARTRRLAAGDRARQSGLPAGRDEHRAARRHATSACMPSMWPARPTAAGGSWAIGPIRPPAWAMPWKTASFSAASIPT